MSKLILNEEKFVNGGIVMVNMSGMIFNGEYDEKVSTEIEDISVYTIDEMLKQNEDDYDDVINHFIEEKELDENITLEELKKIVSEEEIGNVIEKLYYEDIWYVVNYYNNFKDLKLAVEREIEEVNKLQRMVESGELLERGYEQDSQGDTYFYYDVNSSSDEDYSDEEYPFQTINEDDEKPHETYVSVLYDKTRYIEFGDTYVNGTKVYGYAHNDNYEIYYFFEPYDIILDTKEEVDSLKDKYGDRLAVFKFNSIKEGKEFINEELTQLKKYNNDITANKLVREYDYSNNTYSGYYYR